MRGELKEGPLLDHMKANWPLVKVGSVIEVKDAFLGLKEDAKFVVVKSDLLETHMSLMIMDYEFLRFSVTKKGDKFVWGDV